MVALHLPSLLLALALLVPMAVSAQKLPDHKATQSLLVAVSKDDAKAVGRYLKEFPETGSNYIIQGNSPLHIAARFGRKEISTMFLDKGADPIALNMEGLTPAQVARNHGFKELGDFLEETANIRLKDKEEQERNRRKFLTGLFNAVAKGDIEGVKKRLDDHPDAISAILDGKSLLGAALGRGNPELVRLLIERGADVNETLPNGYSPLFVACINRDVMSAQILIKKGANLENASPEGFTPLMAACQSGSAEVVELLLSYGVNMDRKDNHKGMTALHIAAYASNPWIIHMLLAKGMRPDVRDNMRVTPLGICQSAECATLLIDAGADVNAGFSDGHCPLSVACMTGNLSTGELLLKKGADPDTLDPDMVPMLHMCVERGSILMAKLLIEHGASINMRCHSRNGITALHLATALEMEDMVRMLLDKGANPNSENSEGRTPLHLLVSINNTKLAWILLDKGADPNCTDIDGISPLSMAIRHENVAFAKLLLERGVNPNKGKSHQLPLDEAIMIRDLGFKGDAMVDLLRQYGAKTMAELKEEKNAASSADRQF